MDYICCLLTLFHLTEILSTGATLTSGPSIFPRSLKWKIYKIMIDAITEMAYADTCEMIWILSIKSGLIEIFEKEKAQVWSSENYKRVF